MTSIDKVRRFVLKKSSITLPEIQREFGLCFADAEEAINELSREGVIAYADGLEFSVLSTESGSAKPRNDFEKSARFRKMYYDYVRRTGNVIDDIDFEDILDDRAVLDGYFDWRYELCAMRKNNRVRAQEDAVLSGKKKNLSKDFAGILSFRLGKKYPIEVKGSKRVAITVELPELKEQTQFLFGQTCTGNFVYSEYPLSKLDGKYHDVINSVGLYRILNRFDVIVDGVDIIASSKFCRDLPKRVFDLTCAVTEAEKFIRSMGRNPFV